MLVPDEATCVTNYGEVEDVVHFLVSCEELQWERQELLRG